MFTFPKLFVTAFNVFRQYFEQGVTVRGPRISLSCCIIIENI